MVTVVSTMEHARNPLMCILIYIYNIYICTVELKLALFTVGREAGQYWAVEPFFIFGLKNVLFRLCLWMRKESTSSCYVYFMFFIIVIIFFPHQLWS